MKKDEVIKITQKEALEAVENIKTKKLHCFMGFMGADWDKKSVLDLIKKSKRMAWADNPFNHNLAIISEGKLHSFDIQK